MNKFSTVTKPLLGVLLEQLCQQRSEVARRALWDLGYQLLSLVAFPQSMRISCLRGNRNNRNCTYKPAAWLARDSRNPLQSIFFLEHPALHHNIASGTSGCGCEADQEGSSSREALVEDGPHAPQICLTVISLPQQNLRGLYRHMYTI